MEQQKDLTPVVTQVVKGTPQEERVILLGGDRYGRMGEMTIPQMVVDQDVSHFYQYANGKLNIRPMTVDKPKIEEVVSKGMVNLLRRAGVPLRTAK